MKKFTLFLIVFCIIFSSMSINVFAYTIDDVRELVGKDRVDMTYSPEQINTIIQQYNAIEEENERLRRFEENRKVNDMYVDEEEYDRINNEVSENRKAFLQSFQNGTEVEEVLRNKSKYESSLKKLSEVRTNPYDHISVEYLENDWEERYLQVQNLIATVNKQKNIGALLDDMVTPVESSFALMKIYSLSEHEGIDLSANSGSTIQSVWNGSIESIEKEDYGYTVVIKHDEGLNTVYKHLGEVSVSVGDTVTDGQNIGKGCDKPYEYTKSHICFMVELDGEYINPMQLYGEKGIRILQGFASASGDAATRYTVRDMIDGIKTETEFTRETPIEETEDNSGENLGKSSIDKDYYDRMLEEFLKQQGKINGES